MKTSKMIKSNKTTLVLKHLYFKHQHRGLTGWEVCVLFLSDLSSRVQFPGGEGLFWSGHVVCVGFLQVLRSPTIIKNTYPSLISSQRPRPNAQMKTWIWSSGTARQLPDAPEDKMGRTQHFTLPRKCDQ